MNQRICIYLFRGKSTTTTIRSADRFVCIQIELQPNQIS